MRTDDIYKYLNGDESNNLTGEEINVVEGAKVLLSILYPSQGVFVNEVVSILRNYDSKLLSEINDFSNNYLSKSTYSKKQQDSIIKKIFSICDNFNRQLNENVLDKYGHFMDVTANYKKFSSALKDSLGKFEGVDENNIDHYVDAMCYNISMKLKDSLTKFDEDVFKEIVDELNNEIKLDYKDVFKLSSKCATIFTNSSKEKIKALEDCIESYKTLLIERIEADKIINEDKAINYMVEIEDYTAKDAILTCASLATKSPNTFNQMKDLLFGKKISEIYNKNAFDGTEEFDVELVSKYKDFEIHSSIDDLRYCLFENLSILSKSPEFCLKVLDCLNDGLSMVNKDHKLDLELVNSNNLRALANISQKDLKGKVKPITSLLSNLLDYDDIKKYLKEDISILAVDIEDVKEIFLSCYMGKDPKNLTKEEEIEVKQNIVDVLNAGFIKTGNQKQKVYVNPNATAQKQPTTQSKQAQNTSNKTETKSLFVKELLKNRKNKKEVEYVERELVVEAGSDEKNGYQFEGNFNISGNINLNQGLTVENFYDYLSNFGRTTENIRETESKELIKEIEETKVSKIETEAEEILSAEYQTFLEDMNKVYAIKENDLEEVAEDIKNLRFGFTRHILSKEKFPNNVLTMVDNINSMEKDFDFLTNYLPAVVDIDEFKNIYNQYEEYKKADNTKILYMIDSFKLERIANIISEVEESIKENKKHIEESKTLVYKLTYDKIKSFKDKVREIKPIKNVDRERILLELEALKMDRKEKESQIDRQTAKIKAIGKCEVTGEAKKAFDEEVEAFLDSVDKMLDEGESLFLGIKGNVTERERNMELVWGERDKNRKKILDVILPRSSISTNLGNEGIGPALTRLIEKKIEKEAEEDKIDLALSNCRRDLSIGRDVLREGKEEIEKEISELSKTLDENDRERKEHIQVCKEATTLLKNIGMVLDNPFFEGFREGVKEKLDPSVKILKDANIKISDSNLDK